jgi:hypothetical protein
MSMQRWRVVAIRRNRKHIILDEYLLKERAEAFQAALLSINAFPEVWIEPDTGADPDSRPTNGHSPVTARETCRDD